MAYKEIACKYNLCFADKVLNGEEEWLGVGTKKNIVYETYLYFDLSQFTELLYYNPYLSAKLILFKYATRGMSYKDTSYEIFPLKDYMTPYTYEIGKVEVMLDYQINYTETMNTTMTEVDLTSWFKACLTGEIENKGLLIRSENTGSYMSYSCTKSKTMLPSTIRVEYEPAILMMPDFVVDLPVEVQIYKRSQV